ncbi:sugar fermentation stimulation protein [Candidatus Nitromaritima sp. SCGC AAA799-A02]|nr:sugar fermentation stimulation protein [Candidatus Nitromaritima sp. SCGC AAA799-C22]KMP10882.1 sugar fermentation stimulation protein [Candidatus Nitromaritima sp. SCGC AAA799-A02]
MKLGDRIIDGVFLERPNRYLARVEIDGREVSAHVPDPGRLPGLMIPGRRVRLVYNPGPKRKTDYSLVLVRHGSIWVSVYPVFANKLVEQALADKTLDCLRGYSGFKREVRQGNSRFDFQLEFSRKPAFIEVKSVSLVEKGTGRFPDAPTERGVKHLMELIDLKSEGYRAGVLFVSQRSDTRSVTSNDEIDPRFGEWLRKAERAGVELYAYNCKVTSASVSLNRPVPVNI